MIKLDINIGDIILVGRFKNKRIEVKEIGIDEHGLPTINGRSILKIRIEKLMKTKKNLKEGKWNHDAVGRSGPISVYRDGTESVKFYMENDKWMYSVTKPNGDQAPGFSFGKSAGTVDAQYSKYFDNGNIRGMTVAAKKILKEGMIHESKQFNLMNIVKKILKEMRDMDDEYLEMAENIADEYKDFIDKRSIEHEQTDDEGSYTLEFTMVIPISHDDYYSVEDAEEGYQERFNDGPGVEGNPGGQVIHVNVSDVSKEGKNWAVTLYVRGGYDI